MSFDGVLAAVQTGNLAVVTTEQTQVYTNADLTGEAPMPATAAALCSARAV